MINKKNILITSPSLISSENVSGISAVVNNIVTLKEFQFFHFKVARIDGQKKNLKWILDQILLVIKFPVFIINNKISISHINTDISYLSVLRDFPLIYISKLFALKIIVHIHGGKYFWTNIPNNIIHYILKLNINLADRIIVLSDIEKEYIHLKYSIKDVCVIENSVDFDKIPQMVKQYNNLKFSITFLGRIHESKGIDDIIVAIKKLNEHTDNFTFNLCGKGPLEDYCKIRFSEILGKRFNFLGVISDQTKWATLYETDIFLLPSRYGEGLPMAMLEAMAVGTVVVVTDDASIKNVIKPWINGVIVKKYNPDDIFKNIYDLMKNIKAIEEISKNAKSTIYNKYNWEFNKIKLIKLYNTLSN